MTELLDGVDKRTQLIGQNRLELLLFSLAGGKQSFGINVFKVREVVACPGLTRVPGAHALVVGITKLRNQTLPVIDLGQALGQPPFTDVENGFVIITEFNSSVHGFLVRAVESIVNVRWEAIKPPPKGIDNESFMTAVTEVEGRLIEVIDVERVLADIRGQMQEFIADEMDGAERAASMRPVLVVDDSAVARGQIQRALAHIGATCVTARNGREALELLRGWADSGEVDDHISMVISDIEMPEMDGYTLTQKIRRDPRLADLYVLLHSSLSGVLSNEMTAQVGANDYLSKFNPERLVHMVLERAAA